MSQPTRRFRQSHAKVVLTHGGRDAQPQSPGACHQSRIRYVTGWLLPIELAHSCAIYDVSTSDCRSRNLVRFHFAKASMSFPPLPANFSHSSWTYINSSLYDWAPLTNWGLNYSDCGPDVLTLWDYFLADDRGPEEIEDDDVYQAILHSLHDHLREHGFEDPPKDQISKWEQETEGIATALSFAFNGYGTCKMELCPLLGWEGNSDIAGQGVSSSRFAVKYI
jgi:hypothetical protein